MPKKFVTLRRSTLGWLVLAAVSSVAVLSIPAAAAQPTVSVEIKSFAFTPKEITVVPGTRVVWTNRDETPHTVTATDHSFSSAGLDTGDTFGHAFTAEGDFTYFCAMHPYMTAMVHVKKP